jgi:hypothetical protein
MKLGDQLKLSPDDPLRQVMASIDDHLGMRCDTVTFVLFLSLISGRLGRSFHVWLQSVDCCADLVMAKKMLDCDLVETPSPLTLTEFHREYSRPDERVSAAIICSSEARRFRRGCGRFLTSSWSCAAPSLWLISEDPPTGMPLAPEIVIDTSKLDRSFEGIVDETLRNEWSSRSADSPLRKLLQAIPPWMNSSCDFEECFQGQVTTSEMMAANRVMLSIAAARTTVSHRSSSQVTALDYETARLLLLSLPIPSRTSELPTRSAMAGECLSLQFGLDADYAASLPDRSDLGSKLFTRKQAALALDVSYNSAKKYLTHLVEAGVLDEHPTSVGSRPERHFAFRSRPPFLIKNPFATLPPASEVSRGCNQLLQT